jgi:hypothetical protein
MFTEQSTVDDTITAGLIRSRGDGDGLPVSDRVECTLERQGSTLPLRASCE